MRMVPWEEIKARWEKEPGHAEAYAQAKKEFDEEIAIYGTIGNPKPQPRPAFARASTKRKPRGLLMRTGRARAMA